MMISFTLLIILVSAAIVTLFADEFARFFRWLFAIPGALLFLPLLVISVLVINQENNLITVLTFLSTITNDVIKLTLSKLIALVGIPMIPHLYAAYKDKKHMRFRFKYAWLVGFIIFLTLTVLMLFEKTL